MVLNFFESTTNNLTVSTLLQLLTRRIPVSNTHDALLGRVREHDPSAHQLLRQFLVQAEEVGEATPYLNI